jgi:hypothetical protein
MEIDLSNIQYGQIEGKYEENRLKSSNIYNNLSSFNENYNFIIMPMSVFNIIECDPRFKSCEINPTNMFKVGIFCGYDCYVDLYLTENRIILSKDLQRMRENKIDAILGTDELVKNLNIDIIF